MPTLPLRCLLAALVLALTGCGGCRAIEAEAPPRLPPRAAVPAPEISALTLPIEIPAAEIGALLDDVIPAQLYATTDRALRRGLVRARLDLRVRRRGRVVIETRAGQLVTHLPLRAEGRIRLVRGVSRPFETTFTVHAVTDLALDTTWATVAHTRSAFSWRERPTISLLGFDIDVGETAGRAMQQQLARLAPRIDRLIEERVDLRPRIERLWASIDEPVGVLREPPVWLVIEPLEAFFLPPESRPDTLIYGLALRAFVGTTVGEAPTHALGPLPPLRPLPDSLAADSLQTLRIHVPLSISFDDANDLLDDALAERAFEVYDRVAMRLDEIELYGSADTLVARVDFTAKVSGERLRTRGRVYFTGTPVYDADRQLIRVEDFDYDVQSASALAETADWFFRDDILDQIRGRLVFPLADRLAEAQVQLEAAFTDRPVGRHLVLDGRLDTLAPGVLYLTPDGLTLGLSARGTLAARVRDLDDVRRGRDSTAAGETK